MDPIIDKLKGVSGGKILDVATSQGGFLKLLTESFGDYTEAVGIDMAADRIETARNNAGDGLEFRVMDAGSIEFEDGYFDTVAIRHSLHHLKDVDTVLAEMKRVLKPGGLFIVCEVFQSPETLKENSQRHMHHWWAEVDRSMGVPHFDTFSREAVLQYVDKLNLGEKEVFDHMDDYDEADSHEVVKQLISLSETTIQRLQANNGPRELIDKGMELIERFARLGFTDEQVVYIVGRK